ncbi:hypothetical protein R7Y21_07435 [Vibrio sp. 945]|nr:hypothetical protein [Vibrio sp. 945]
MALAVALSTSQGGCLKMFDYHKLDCDHIIACDGIEFGFNETTSECWFAVCHTFNACAVTVHSVFEPQTIFHSVVSIYPNRFPAVSFDKNSVEFRFDDIDCYKQFCRHFSINPCQKVLQDMEAQ